MLRDSFYSRRAAVSECVCLLRSERCSGAWLRHRRSESRPKEKAKEGSSSSPLMYHHWPYNSNKQSLARPHSVAFWKGASPRLFRPGTAPLISCCISTFQHSVITEQYKTNTNVPRSWSGGLSRVRSCCQCRCSGSGRSRAGWLSA